MEYATAGPRVTFVTIPGSYSGYPWAWTQCESDVFLVFAAQMIGRRFNDAFLQFCRQICALCQRGEPWPNWHSWGSGRWILGGGGSPKSIWGMSQGQGLRGFLRKRTHQELPVLGRVKHPNSPLEFFFTSPILSKLQECCSKQRTWQYETICSWGELLIIVGRQMPSWWQFCSLWVNWVQQLPSSCRH